MKRFILFSGFHVILTETYFAYSLGNRINLFPFEALQCDIS